LKRYVLRPVCLHLANIPDLRKKQNSLTTAEITNYLNLITWDATPTNGVTCWIELTLDFLLYYTALHGNWPAGFSPALNIATLSKRFSSITGYIFTNNGTALPAARRRAIRALRCFGIGDASGLATTCSFIHTDGLLATLLEHGDLHCNSIHNNKQQPSSKWHLSQAMINRYLANHLIIPAVAG
jgi:hypothetical protein